MSGTLIMNMSKSRSNQDSPNGAQGKTNSTARNQYQGFLAQAWWDKIQAFFKSICSQILYMINNIINKPYLIMRIRPKDSEIGHKLSTSSIIINNLNTVTSNRSLNHLRTIFLFENKVSMGSHRPRSPRTKMLRPRRCRPINYGP